MRWMDRVDEVFFLGSMKTSHGEAPGPMSDGGN